MKECVIAVIMIGITIASAASYRAEHESFVSNLKGTSITCILFYLAHAPACVFLLKLVQGNRKPSIVRDICFLVMPLLLSMTILSNHSYWSLPCLISIGFVVSKYHQRSQKDHVLDIDATITLTDYLGPHPSYLSLFKGANVLITCLAILAVDFKVFPRRFAKTETFGIGLMDMGVGTFIVASAVTSGYARGQVPIRRLCPIQMRTWRRVFVLLLGVGRLVVIKLIGYPEHVSEYGVHWNFFITQYAVWLLADVVHRCVPRLVIPWVAILTLLAYQLALIVTPLTDYIIAAPRNTIFSANREGVFSLLGLLPLHLLSEAAAFHIFFRGAELPGKAGVRGKDSSVELLESEVQDGGQGAEAAEGPEVSSAYGSDRDQSHCGQVSPTVLSPGFRVLQLRPIRRILLQLATCSLVLLVAWIAATTVQQTSRRLANMAFVFLTLTLSSLLILAMVLADILGGISVKVRTLESLNAGQLPAFLFANLLTGLVNLSMRTLYVAPAPALFVLITYSAAVVAMAWALDSTRTLSSAAVREPDPVESVSSYETVS